MQSPFDSPIGAGGFDPATVREHLRNLQADAERRAADTQALASRLETLTATATDEAHACTVVVDHAGHVTSLVLTERIRGRQPEWLSQTIMDTIAAARAALAEQTREAVGETLGEDSAAGQAILRRLAAQDPDAPAGA